MPFRLIAIGVTLLLGACSKDTPPETPEPAFVGSSACRDCHEAQYADWQDSHHDLAMQVASADSVLADFGAPIFRYFDTETRFQARDGNFFVLTDDADGEPREFRVAYTFGVYPLQQYLVETDNGRVQVLPFAWDSRAAQVGGQRWYHLYPDEYIGPGDPLFWTGRQQNWNYMCAECHSTNLQVNYDLASDRFATTWSEIDVGCEGCHGPGAVHVQQARLGRAEGNSGLAINLDDHGRAVWRMNLETGIAERSEFRMRPPAQPEACGRCHARRGLITSEYEYGRPLADTHRVALLDDALYFDDGQIHDEVFVYGSFLQSRMYAAGVTCSDCHNPHSTSLVSGANPNAVCSQCHLPERFASPEHSRHQPADAGCVDCHMTARVYMGVDARRDHSFRVPRPDLSAATGSPNACNTCHGDQDPDWAAARISAWNSGNLPARHFGTALHNARNGSANDELVAVVRDAAVPGIARATALTLLTAPLRTDDITTIQAALADGDAQVRIGALNALREAPMELRVRLGAPLLGDRVRSVRIEAAAVLAPVRDLLPAANAAMFNSAADEFREAQLAIASRPEAHAVLGDFAAATGDKSAALRHYERALVMEPNAAATRVNFADALRLFGDEVRAEAVLREGIQLDNANAAMRHSLGLLLSRSNRAEEGLVEFRLAAKLQPENSRYHYVLAIALNSAGESGEAVSVLESSLRRFPGDYDMSWALATISRDRGELERAVEIAQQLAKQYPDNRDVSRLLETLASP